MTLIFRSLIKVFVLLAVLAAMLEFMDLSFTLNGARQTLSKKLTSYTGRDVRIDGDIHITLSYFPRLLVNRIHIGNPNDFDDEDFITVSEIQIEVLLLPLLRGQVHLSDISADQAKINLHQKSDDSNNWLLTETTAQPVTTDKKATYSETEGIGIDRISVGKIELTNIAIQYRDDSRKQILNNNFDQMLIDISDDTKPLAEINGKIEGYPYAITFESESTEHFLAGERWLVHGTGHIANRQTNIEANIQYKENEFIADLNFDVKNVDLGQLLDELEIVSGQEAITDNINTKAKLHGKNLAELYEQAEVSLKLGKGYWALQTTEEEQNKKLTFTSASSFTSWHKPVELHLDGTIEDEPITIDFKSNLLLEFFDDVQKMDIDLVSSVADKEITVKGTLDLPIKTRQFELDISIKGKDLEKINQLINTEFPPFNNYSFTGNLIANNKGYVLKSASASIGDTKLQASIVIETNVPKPLWHINLNSQQLQLKDFAFDDWSIKQPATTTEKSARQVDQKNPHLEPLRRLEDLVKTTDMHLDLNLKVDKVLSGQDHLGRVQLQLHLRDDTFNIENAKIEIPGGNISSSILFELDDNEAIGHLTLDIDKLDYGITTRLFQPDSQINGIISTRIDLQLSGKNFTRLLENASGQIDFAVWPKNTKPAKALNLWTTNLYLILLPELKKQESLVNCIVGLMDVDDGKMKEELFAIDTTSLWIDGNVNVDYKKEYVELSLFPRSKTARLFALQTPIRAQGSFSNINLLLNPIDLTESYFSFITSPLHVPVRRAFGDKMPADGSATCEKLFDREYVIKLKAELDKKDQKTINELLDAD